MSQVCTPLTWGRSDVRFGDASITFGMVETCVTVAVGGGGVRGKRKRYLLPDDRTVVWATEAEIEDILQQYVVPEEPKQKRKRRRKAKPDPFIPVEIERWEPVLDMQFETFRPVLPQGFMWKLDLKRLTAAAQRLERRRQAEEEELILMLLS